MDGYESSSISAAKQVVVAPQPVRETIHDEYLRALVNAESLLREAVAWGELHPNVPASRVDDLSQAGITMRAAIDDLAGTPGRAVPHA